LVERASISEAQLLNREMASSVPALLAKIARLHPRVVCFNGKGIWLHVERSLQQQLILSDGPGGSAAIESGVVVPKREDEERKPNIVDADQERPVKTERELTAGVLPQPLLKKDTSSDDAAVKSGVVVPKKEEEDSEPSMDTDQPKKRPIKTKRERVASRASSTTADSSGLDTGRVLRPSTSAMAPVGHGSAVPSPPPVTPRRAGTAAQTTFAYGIQPYKAVHDVIPKAS